MIVMMEDAEKLCVRTNSSVIALTLRVETLCTYISAKAATNARSGALIALATARSKNWPVQS